MIFLSPFYSTIGSVLFTVDPVTSPIYSVVKTPYSIRISL